MDLQLKALNTEPVILSAGAGIQRKFVPQGIGEAQWGERRAVADAQTSTGHNLVAAEGIPAGPQCDVR